MQLPIVGGYTRKHTKSLFIVFQSKLAETRFGCVAVVCYRSTARAHLTQFNFKLSLL